MEGTKKELMALVDGKGNSDKFIDQVVDVAILHKFDDQDVLEVAAEQGYLISRCLVHDERYRANGVWLQPNTKLQKALENYPHITANYCDKCNEARIRAEYMKKYQSYRSMVPSSTV